LSLAKIGKTISRTWNFDFSKRKQKPHKLVHQFIDPLSKMSELKQKKVARDQAITASNDQASKKSAADAESLNKAISQRAASYEKEYEQVKPLLILFSLSDSFCFLVSANCYQ
jgi:biopolymer transport protein ExbB/TolQ